MSAGTRLTKSMCDNAPTLKISMLAWDKIWKITHNSKVKNTYYECSSLGIMNPKDPSHLLDIYVPEQENGTTETAMCDSDKNRWISEMISSGVDASQLSLWHHTHADMGVFWSSTDTSTIQTTQTDEIHWSVVTNVKGELKIRADIFHPIRFWWDDCDYEVDYPSVDLNDWWKGAKAKMTFVAPTVRHQISRKGLKKGGKKNQQNYYSPGRGFGYTNMWGGVGWEDDYSVHPSPKEIRPTEILSNSKLQSAYDEELITHTEAMALEKELLVNNASQESVEEVLDTLITSGGLELDTASGKGGK